MVVIPDKVALLEIPTVSTDMAVLLLGRLTDVGLTDADKPGGTSDTFRLTVELKPLIEVTVTDAELELDVIRLIGSGEIAMEKSMLPAGRVARNVCEQRPFDPPAPVGSAETPMVMSVRVWLFGGVSKSMRNAVVAGSNDGPANPDLSWIRSVLPEGSCTGQMLKGL
jgi:hypothetical protein